MKIYPMVVEIHGMPALRAKKKSAQEGELRSYYRWPTKGWGHQNSKLIEAGGDPITQQRELLTIDGHCCNHCFASEKL